MQSRALVHRPTGLRSARQRQPLPVGRLRRRIRSLSQPSRRQLQYQLGGVLEIGFVPVVAVGARDGRGAATEVGVAVVMGVSGCPRVQSDPLPGMRKSL